MARSASLEDAGAQPADRSRFGLLVKDWRERRCLTQAQLADLSAVSVRAIRDLEAGRTGHPHPI
ncbi:MAG: helix-turn-helix domain-containing protein, partial [Trebonia sp.]